MPRPHREFMSVSIVVRDKRLEGRTPVSTPGFMSLDVNEGTPLEYFFDRVRSIAEAQRGISTLYIMTHGAKGASAGDSDEDSGIILCQEFVHLGNVDRFAAMAGIVEHIVLLIFLPAATSFDIHLLEAVDPKLPATFHGGDELCRQMAIHAKTRVSAARETQFYAAEEHCTTFAGYEVYCEAGFVDFGEWEGTIIQYDAKGNLIAEWTNPSPWRDLRGVIQDPRLEPRP